ncbi:hypothetical protein [Treponema sp.]|uniref:hypothetical protein n=1 Tax=Treponema sp. TaxID=166 RepID=UPI00298DADC0|nr:hypothetical protein [Treponema sp.]MCQ2241584.1 hypothetical protein [Treponema sp.]
MKKIFTLLIAAVLSVCVYAQSADKVSEIISTKEATYGQSAYLTASALGIVKNNATYEDALEILKDKGVVSSSVKASDVINLRELSWLCAYTWKIEGSLMLKLFNTPRYTFRQMKADEVIADSADPMDVPSGRNLLAVITDCIGKYEVNAGENK